MPTHERYDGRWGWESETDPGGVVRAFQEELFGNPEVPEVSMGEQGRSSIARIPPSTRLHTPDPYKPNAP